MVLILGIHVGHHASCAVVRDGELVAAVQLERLSRRKHHKAMRLTNELPIHQVLNAAGARLDDVDLIVSSFSAASPGGIGLGQGLVSRDFDIFDPCDARHRVVSHHLAHAHSAFETSGLKSSAILVCDYAGSTTVDGADYDLPFAEWSQSLTKHVDPIQPRTEWFSIYRAVTGQPYELLERRFCVAHPQQNVFVHHVAGLYENVSDYVFGSEQAHGQLMALAASGVDLLDGPSDPGCLYSVGEGGEPQLRNDWQHRLSATTDDVGKAALAYRCQEATEAILCFHAARARQAAEEDQLCVAGGVFLNILANTAIWRSGGGRPVIVPSAPHDAGIAIGCAYLGWRRLKPEGVSPRVVSDALGPRSSRTEIDDALARFDLTIDVATTDHSKIARLLAGGRIVARVAGRSEFGPRALGGRSLLADPRDPRIKDRLNSIKGRQGWRPVAPIVASDRVQEFFDGPPDSPWMNMSYTVRPHVRQLLGALRHPDHSTRPQTLAPDQDRTLYDLLMAFERESGVPILVNTSLNRRLEPIVQTPRDALEMFLDRPDIDALLIEDRLILRKPSVDLASSLFKLAEGAILTRSVEASSQKLCLIHGERVWMLDRDMFDVLAQAGGGGSAVAAADAGVTHAALFEELVQRGVMVRA